ncbi:MAG: aminoglycoside phosphotransferase family protein [Ruminococcaceae bacterium]|nr:aminoglycoside phosphotransferase family protein [Oscillospiraceae bacterium]
MNELKLDALKQVENFLIEGKVKYCEPYGNGHINDTFLVVCDTEKGEHQYILQSINTKIFIPAEVMSNIEKVTDYLKAKSNNPRENLILIKKANGEAYHIDESGRCWRVYEFVTDSLCLERPESVEDFKECAKAFGKFQKDLASFPAESLFETIKDFHNTPKRYNDFLKAVSQDVCGRAKEVEAEIAFVKERESFYSVLLDANKRGELPLRVSHNDTKLNNVMLDKNTRTALCVIDLDTIMPGFSVTDFGDSIRFGASTAAEDEKDLSKVKLDIGLFKAYTEGFLENLKDDFKPSEIMLLPEGAKMMTIECGMRFLTDYLAGDTYFKTKYPEHNLDRCRTQFKLVKEMEDNWDTLKEIVKKYC